MGFLVFEPRVARGAHNPGLSDSIRSGLFTVDICINVPDGGMTVGLLSFSIVGLGVLKRKIAAS
jgi:hypothetical protein